MTNRQSRSVANQGDILKHALLVELASVLARSGLPVSFVETHTFLLQAPPADREKWELELGSLLARYPAYQSYATLEREALARSGLYRCSSGLVLDVLGQRRACSVHAEANGLTRAELAEQLKSEGWADAHLVDDAVRVDRQPRVQSGGALLVQVDPFSLTTELWESLTPALDALHARSKASALVVYRYTRQAPSPWPAAPSGTVGPVIETHGGPHQLAAYASPDLSDPIRQLGQSLGWRTGY